MRAVTLEEAVACFEHLPHDRRPATLHPFYTVADARRDVALEPVHLLFSSQGEQWLHSLHTSRIPGTPLRDASSPYGYGGPIASTSDEAFLKSAWAAHVQWMRSQSVVAEYLRFHPMIDNARAYPGAISPNRSVVWIDLHDTGFAQAYARRLRGNLRKSESAGLRWCESPLATQAAAFGHFYRDAMYAMETDPFYLFGDEYFAQLGAVPGARLAVASSAHDEGTWLAACIVLDGAGLSEYHLAASAPAGRAVAASAWLLARCIDAAAARGQAAFYLGGGSTAAPDNQLLFFKSAFSSQRLMYRTGSTIFDDASRTQLALLYPQAWAAHPGRPIFHRKV